MVVVHYCKGCYKQNAGTLKTVEKEGGSTRRDHRCSCSNCWASTGTLTSSTPNLPYKPYLNRRHGYLVSNSAMLLECVGICCRDLHNHQHDVPILPTSYSIILYLKYTSSRCWQSESGHCVTYICWTTGSDDSLRFS